MKKSLLKRTVFAMMLSMKLITALGQVTQTEPTSKERRATIFLLGTFHFQDAGLDTYKPSHHIDILSTKRQKEIQTLLNQLAKFQPTKIAVEWNARAQAKLDSVYHAYRAQRPDSLTNEIYQIGFRLAMRFNQQRVYAIDAPARWYDSTVTTELLIQRALQNGQSNLVQRGMEWDAYYTHLYEEDDSLKTELTLSAILKRGNSRNAVRRTLGRYLVGEIEVGGSGDYVGTDMRSAWYNRNLRIFSNIIRLPSQANERILVIIGGGHVPILQHLFENSPEYKLISIDSYLR